MAKLILNAGLANNDKTGDTLRAGALKIKSNFEEIYTALASDGSIISGGNVLKTGSYSDLSNKPIFSSVAVSGNFYDLEDRPDLGILVGEPPNETGTDGNIFGNMAYSGGNFYFCFADYVQQISFLGVNAINDGNYHLNIPWIPAYQALLDAVNIGGMSLSVNPGTDGNWRNITAISKNIGTIKLDITYEGSNFAATTGINVRINQPQIWKSIPWAPNYASVFPGDSGSGDWTWPLANGMHTQALLGGSQGSFIDGQSPGGLMLYNDSAITLTAGAKYASLTSDGNFQLSGDLILQLDSKIVITSGMLVETDRGTLSLGGDMEAPGVPSHFHIAFKDSNITPLDKQLFLGDDYNYVSVSALSGGVQISAYDRVANVGDIHHWNFGADGQFTLPAGGNVVLSTGAPAFVSISVLKQLVSDSTGFADFQSRIAAL